MGKHVVTIFAGGWFLAPGVDIAILLDELKKYKTPSQYHEPPSTTIQPPIQSRPATVKELPPHGGRVVASFWGTGERGRWTVPCSAHRVRACGNVEGGTWHLFSAGYHFLFISLLFLFWSFPSGTN